MELRLDIDMREVERRLTGGLVKRIPATMSDALNTLAFQARTRVVRELPDTFTLRGKWTERGLIYEKSTAKHLVAVVGADEQRAYLAPHASAPAEVADSKDQMIPLTGTGRPRVRETSRTTKPRWPSGSAWKTSVSKSGRVTKRSTFWGSPTGVSDDEGLWLRVYKNKKHKKKEGSRPVPAGLRLLYRKRRSIRLGKQWPLERQVTQVVRDGAAAAIDKAIEKTLEKAK